MDVFVEQQVYKLLETWGLVKEVPVENWEIWRSFVAKTNIGKQYCD